MYFIQVALELILHWRVTNRRSDLFCCQHKS